MGAICCPLYLNEVFPAITSIREKRERSVMMSSVIPSEKYSCPASPLMSLNGRTMRDGRSETGA